MADKKSTTFKKGEKRPGQGKRGPGKVPTELKGMILQALDGAGGVAYLQARAKDPKTASAFLALIGKTLPLTVTGPNGDGSHSLNVSVNFVRASKPS